MDWLISRVGRWAAAITMPTLCSTARIFGSLICP